jgi:alkanesulfonate monooxygenase SsuD/methylene tetrahydromethanopterin reductase-like flavin-dependent oxidoreductase (luciferase family)
MARGFLYLVVVMDWVSRYILAWRLSNLLDASFCTTSLAQKDYPEQPLTDITIDRLIDAGTMVVGTPDDAIAKIRELNEASGGIGGVLNMILDWGTREQQLHSYAVAAAFASGGSAQDPGQPGLTHHRR